MKKVILILVALVLTLCLVGCAETNQTKPELREEENSSIRIWTDEETGVQYIVYCDRGGYAGMGGITPRLNADGTLYVAEESEDTE